MTTPSPARVNPLLCVTSYAPIRGRSTLLEQLLARAKRGEPGFYASIITGVDQITATCPWISAEFLARMKATQPAKVYRRVFLNQPVSDTDDDDRYCFSSAQIDACVDPSWQRQDRRPADAIGNVIIGIDFAPKNDASAVAALTRLRDGSIVLLDLVVRHGSRKQPLSSSWVLEVVLDLVARFGEPRIIADPTGIVEELATLRARRFDVTEVSRGGPKLADALYRAIAGRKIRLFSGAGSVVLKDGRRYSLADELRHLLLDTATGKMGHVGEGTRAGRHFDDRCTAIALALQAPELDVASAAALQFDATPFLENYAADFVNGIPATVPSRVFGPDGAGTSAALQQLGHITLPADWVHVGQPYHDQVSLSDSLDDLGTIHTRRIF